VHQEPAYRSPFSSGTPGAPGWLYGTEVVATATENLVRSRFIVQPNVIATLALLFGLSLIVATSTFSAGRLGAASISLFFAAATVAAAWAGLDGADLQIPIVAPLLTIAVAFFGSSAYAAYGDGLKRRRIRLGFAGHVAPAVAAQLSRQPERLRSEGDRRNVTVLTANLSGLNGLSARLEPERLVALMNPCLDELIQLIIEEGGSVDTAMGGALEAVFGAPAENAQHAAAACRAALQMRKRLRDRARSWDVQGSHRVDLHAGIDTGDTIVGSIGGTHRFAYSAIGEPVGVSAALEGLCARYEIGVLVTENVVTAAGKAIRVREIDRVAIHEDESPHRVFELIGLADEPPAWPVQFLGFWQRGLDAYRQRDFSLAADFFLAAAELDPADTPSTMYLERCRAFVAAPPPEDWDDVQRWEMR
jgi:adenylate cyclase